MSQRTPAVEPIVTLWNQWRLAYAISDRMARAEDRRTGELPWEDRAVMFRASVFTNQHSAEGLDPERHYIHRIEELDKWLPGPANAKKRAEAKRTFTAETRRVARIHREEGITKLRRRKKEGRRVAEDLEREIIRDRSATPSAIAVKLLLILAGNVDDRVADYAPQRSIACAILPALPDGRLRDAIAIFAEHPRMNIAEANQRARKVPSRRRPSSNNQPAFAAAA